MEHPSLGRIVMFEPDAATAERMTKGNLLGNPVAVGDKLPAMVVRVTPGNDIVNLKVFRDGPSDLWVTNVPQGIGPGTWNWPQRV